MKLFITKLLLAFFVLSAPFTFISCELKASSKGNEVIEVEILKNNAEAVKPNPLSQ